ncbi:MAG TPA: NAD(P)/FAD-dependent oxidoreductase [Chitinophagaceae bacterium]
MQLLHEKYDIAIVGGGLAGLSSSILLAGKGYSVVLFEMDKYPYYKVCGEYISLESWDFLKSLGLNLEALNLPIIKRLQLTAPNGKVFNTNLPLGGFGISRYTLDSSLAQIARSAGVLLMEETKVEDIFYNEGLFKVSYRPKDQTAVQSISSRLCMASYGKRSNLDLKWNRKFAARTNKQLDNYVAVKYHVTTDWPNDLIGLHNFREGYCGISKVEGDKYCLCYMTTSKNMKATGGQIQQLERDILSKNKYLESLLQNSKKLEGFPVTISQISFQSKTKIENHILMLGDAAGMITPLCGNGMSIALHTAKLAAEISNLYLSGKITAEQLGSMYKQNWSKHFATRLAVGRTIQSFFGGTLLTNMFISGLRLFPFVAAPIIRATHGKPF